MDNKDRLWSIQDASTFLHVAEKTVMRMIQRGELPAVRVGSQWRLLPAQLNEWLANQQSRPASVADLLRTDPMAVPFDRLLREDEISVGVDLSSAEAVLSHLAARVGAVYPEIDVAEYTAALVEREALVSTALGNGIAVPHIRSIESNPPGSLDLFLLVTARDVSFSRETCRIFCLACTDDLVLHLRLIQKISYVLKQEEVADSLLRCTTPAQVIATILKWERTMQYEEA